MVGAVDELPFADQSFDGPTYLHGFITWQPQSFSNDLRLDGLVALSGDQLQYELFELWNVRQFKSYLTKNVGSADCNVSADSRGKSCFNEMPASMTIKATFGYVQ